VGASGCEWVRVGGRRASRWVLIVRVVAGVWLGV